jgi:hypothetical protein
MEGMPRCAPFCCGVAVAITARWPYRHRGSLAAGSLASRLIWKSQTKNGLWIDRWRPASHVARPAPLIYIPPRPPSASLLHHPSCRVLDHIYTAELSSLVPSPHARALHGRTDRRSARPHQLSWPANLERQHSVEYISGLGQTGGRGAAGGERAAIVA